MTIQDFYKETMDTIVSSIAALSNPDWTEKRKAPEATLDEIHNLTCLVIGGVLQRMAGMADSSRTKFRACDDCDFETVDTDCIVCPHCNGCVT